MYTWLDTYLKTRPGAVKAFKIEWGATLYTLDDKMFAMIGENKEKEDILSLKLDPEQGHKLREKYPDVITPGYYLNKLHWNSIKLNQHLDEKLMKSLIDASHHIIFHALPKHRQKALLDS